MWTVLGMVLSVGGASAALAALHALRGDACPACPATGGLVVVRLAREETPGLAPVVHRSRRCPACGATVLDRRSPGPAGRRLTLVGLPLPASR